jgi:hypothetical protein
MARKLDKTELARKDLIDMVRTRKRLEHRIAQRRELNDLEDAVLAEFERRVSNRQPYELSFSDIDAVEAELPAGDA